MAWTQEKINELYEKVQRMAATDEEFRTEILQDTRTAIEKVAGEALPEDFKIKVVENNPQYAATFVLPPMVTEELDEDLLEKVAGGACFIKGCAAEACAADASLK